MKIAIHHRQGSFSERWIEYCQKKSISYEVVNAFDSDIISQLKDCDAFMWHHHHEDFKDIISAKKILFALEHAGVRVFPDFKTSWHFDDKVAQKYLLEAVGAPLVPSYVFYDKKEASDWAKKTSYPKVFKLKGGAGATNVKLVKNRAEALKLINKAFGKGFTQFDSLNNFKERYNKYRNGKDTLLGVAKGIGRLAITPNFAKQQSPEKGYIYFQDFMPNNGFDIRIIVIGEKAFAIKRLVRPDDFRASGSGSVIYNRQEINERCLEIAFSVNKKAGLQCVAFDFIYDDEEQPVIVEISYGFSIEAYDSCPGYWDSHLTWHKGQFSPQEWMLEDLIKAIEAS